MAVINIAGQQFVAVCNDLKYACMQEVPQLEKYPIAIQFLATSVIVMGEAILWTCSSWIYKKPHVRVWMLKFC